MLNFFYFFNTFLFVSKINSNLASGAIRLWIIVFLSKNQTQTCPAGQSPPGNIGSELESTSRTWNHNILLFCKQKTLSWFLVLYCVENPPHTWSYSAHGQWRPLGQCSCHRHLWNHQPSKTMLEHSNKTLVITKEESCPPPRSTPPQWRRWGRRRVRPGWSPPSPPSKPAVLPSLVLFSLVQHQVQQSLHLQFCSL